MDEAKRKARAEVEAYRERQRKEREARQRASESAETEIAREIQARRADEAKRAGIAADRARMWAEREERIAEQRRIEKQQAAAGGNTTVLVETPARRLAKRLRQRLGDDFNAVAAEIMSVNFKLFRLEVARIPQDERAEALYLERQARAAEIEAAALELPEPEDTEERDILRRHGFPVPVPSVARRQAELDAGIL
ncbi:hypothetical protein [Methylobacterium oryzihabitans]|uniref:hypothetical protein n=1 Tax=Methylobacterium oryzihabitans TaxID=2499852 RepID=UPI000FDC2F5C|nr:hypothetical protein [Methylobacterium oryzihabitans]